jgi:hypothetical protein
MSPIRFNEESGNNIVVPPNVGKIENWMKKCVPSTADNADNVLPPISGDLIMGNKQIKPVENAGISFTLVASYSPSPNSMKRRASIEEIKSVSSANEAINISKHNNDLPSDDCDEIPKKICKYQQKSVHTNSSDDPEVIEIDSSSENSHLYPTTLESVQNDAEYEMRYAELERRLNEPLPVPRKQAGDEDAELSSEQTEDSEENDEGIGNEIYNGDDDEEFILSKSRKPSKRRTGASAAIPAVTRPGSMRGRLKNCDKISRWLVTLLRNPDHNPSVITWINAEDGVFKIINSSKLAHLWGLKKGNPNMDYSKLSRAMRYYYKTGELVVVNSRLTYRFGDIMTNWQPLNKSDPNFSQQEVLPLT